MISPSTKFYFSVTFDIVELVAMVTLTHYQGRVCYHGPVRCTLTPYFTNIAAAPIFNANKTDVTSNADNSVSSIYVDKSSLPIVVLVSVPKC